MCFAQIGLMVGVSLLKDLKIFSIRENVCAIETDIIKKKKKAQFSIKAQKGWGETKKLKT